MACLLTTCSDRSTLACSRRQWTQSLHAAIDVFDFPNLFNIRTACLGNGYQYKLVVVALGPIIFVCVLMAATVAWKVGRVCRRSGVSELRRLRREYLEQSTGHRRISEVSYRRIEGLLVLVQRATLDGLETSMPVALLVSFVCVTTVSATIFKARSCEGFGDIDDVPAVDRQERYYLKADLSVLCYESEAHQQLLNIMWVFVFVWPCVTASRSHHLWVMGRPRARTPCFADSPAGKTQSSQN